MGRKVTLEIPDPPPNGYTYAWNLQGVAPVTDVIPYAGFRNQLRAVPGDPAPWGGTINDGSPRYALIWADAYFATADEAMEGLRRYLHKRLVENRTEHAKLEVCLARTYASPGPTQDGTQ